MEFSPWTTLKEVFLIPPTSTVPIPGPSSIPALSTDLYKNLIIAESSFAIEKTRWSNLLVNVIL